MVLEVIGFQYNVLTVKLLCNTDFVNNTKCKFTEFPYYRKELSEQYQLSFELSIIKGLGYRSLSPPSIHTSQANKAFTSSRVSSLTCGKLK